MDEREFVIADNPGQSSSLRESVDSAASLAELETHLLLDGVYRLSGYDFRGYQQTWVRRRIAECTRAEQCANVTRLLERVLHDPAVLERLLYNLTVIPEKIPFADTEFFSQVMRYVIPRLRTYPYFRIWVAGSGGKHDLYALAILLHEAGLLGRARIYATEASKLALEDVRKGSLPREMLAMAEEAYKRAGGSGRFQDYVTESEDGLTYVEALKESILFARHDLATEGSFNEFEAVFTQGTLGLYSRSLAYRAHQTLFESTARFGFMCVGSRDVMMSSPHRHAYEPVADSDRIVRRVR